MHVDSHTRDCSVFLLPICQREPYPSCIRAPKEPMDFLGRIPKSAGDANPILELWNNLHLSLEYLQRFHVLIESLIHYSGHTTNKGKIEKNQFSLLIISNCI